MFKSYYRLAKPGIVYGNLLTAGAGFLLAAKGTIDGRLFIVFLAGIALVMASACVFNNILDRNIDKKMKRTKLRATVTGEISLRSAALYGVVLGITGFWLLANVNWLVFWLGAAAHVLYVVVYGIAKRKSVHGTLVGAIPGAMPPMAGYAAVTSGLDGGAWLLFCIMVAWQMPHFYSIAIFRRKEYEAAHIPVLSVVRGVASTKRQMLAYVSLFAILTLLLSYLGYTGALFAVVMTVLSFIWLFKIRRGSYAKDNDKWARALFGYSLKVLLVFCVMLSIEAWIL